MRHIFGRGRRTVASNLALLVLLVLVFGALPAGAHTGGDGDAGTGEGAGTGTEEQITTGAHTADPFCLEVKSSKYRVEVPAGVFTAQEDDDVAVDTGPATITFRTMEKYYIAPEGTYGLAGCPATSFGPADPVDVEVTVQGPGINCGTREGEYFRVNTAITVAWEGSCHVDDDLTPAVAHTPASTQHVFEGNFVACPPEDPFTQTDTCGVLEDNDLEEAEENQIQGTWSYAGPSS